MLARAADGELRLKSMSSCGFHWILPLRATRAIAAKQVAVREVSLLQPILSKFAAIAAVKVPPGSLEILVPAQTSKWSIDFGKDDSWAT